MFATDDTQHRRFVKRFAPPMMLYVFLQMGVTPLIRSTGPTTGKVLLAIVPLLALAWALVELVRHVSGLDEMQRRQHFESAGVAGLLTTCAVFSWSFMELAGLPPLPAMVVLPVFCLVYLIRYWQMTRQTG